MSNPYVESRDGVYWLTETRISLESLVYAFRRGASPETMRSSFPSLTLEHVYGALAFYLSKQQEIDDRLRELELAYAEAMRASHQQLRRENPELHARLNRNSDGPQATRS